MTPPSELAPAGAPFPVPEVESDNNIPPEAEPAPETLPAAHPEQADKKVWPRWFMPVMSGVAAAAVAITAWAATPREIRENLKTRFIPGYAAGERDPQRASVVGLQFNLSDMSDESFAALTADNDSVFAALRDNLAAAYGPAYDFDLYYRRPPFSSDGSDYIPFGPDAAEENADEAPKDTITMPLDITGELTPEHFDEIVSGIIEQITPQLLQWGYKPGETVTVVDSTSGTEVTIVVPPTTEEEGKGDQPTDATSGGTKPPTGTNTPPTNKPTNPPTQPPASTLKPTNPPVITTKNPETTQSQEKNPQTLQLSKDQVINVAAHGSDLINFSKFPSGVNLEFNTNIGTILFHRDASYNDTTKFKNDAKETIGIYQKKGDGSYQRIATKTYTVDDHDGYDDPGYFVAIATDKSLTDEFDGVNHYYSYCIMVGGHNGVPFAVSFTKDMGFVAASDPGLIKLF